MQPAESKVRSVADMPSDTRRGGDLRVLLSPKTVGAGTGFMGVATIPPGDKISEHYHPYSEEFVYVTKGTMIARLDGTPHEVKAGQGVFIPINQRHRFMNEGKEEVAIVFHLCPLAPRPDLGHVDTE